MWNVLIMVTQMIVHLVDTFIFHPTMFAMKLLITLPMISLFLSYVL